jgi:hypothetical protein
VIAGLSQPQNTANIFETAQLSSDQQTSLVPVHQAQQTQVEQMPEPEVIAVPLSAFKERHAKDNFFATQDSIIFGQPINYGT